MAKSIGRSRESIVYGYCNKVVELYDDEADFENYALETYRALYDGTGYSDAQLIEEMLCDMFAGMNELSNTAVDVFSLNTQERFYEAAERLMNVAGNALADEVYGSEYYARSRQQKDINSSASTGIELKNRDKYSLEMKEVIDGYLDSTNEKILNFIEKYDNDKKFARLSLIAVTSKQAADIKRLTGIDVSGYTNAINTNAVQHIEKRHGANGLSDNTMKDVSDIARLEFVLKSYDNVILSENTDSVKLSKEFRDKYNRPVPTLRFSKKINGTYYVVLAVPESEWKKVWIVSAFMNEKEDAISHAPDVQAPRLRPTTSRTAIASSDIEKVSQRNEKSKQDFHNRKDYFSIETVDSEGNRLSKKQAEYFEKSKIRDEDGNLKVMYHGTDNGGFTIFDRGKAKSSGHFGTGFYFAPTKTYSSAYTDNSSNSKIYEAYLNITNPVDAVDESKTLSKIQVKKLVKAIAQNEDYGIENYGYDATVDSVTNDLLKHNSDFEIFQDLDATCVGDFVELVELANKVIGTSFDGIRTPLETIAFNPNQIKLTENANPTDNVDIRFSKELTDEEFHRAFKKWNETSISEFAEILKNDRVYKGVKTRKKNSEARQKLLNVTRRLERMKTTSANRALIASAIGDLDTVSVGITGKTYLNFLCMKKF